MDCPFCTIKSISERKIIENDLAWSFPSNMPITPWHILIVPKRCVKTFFELTHDEKNAIFDLVEKLKLSLIKAFDYKWFNYAWNEWKEAGQSVKHFHLHLVPRKPGDTWIYKYEPREFLYRPGLREESSNDELKEVSKLIKNNIKID